MNTNTGRVTEVAGGTVVGPEGAARGGAFSTEGPRGEAQGAGGFHYNADTGTYHRGGVVNVNDNVYAGRDGNVYHYENGQWNEVSRPDDSRTPGAQPSQRTPENLDRERQARERGDQRINGGNYQRSPQQRSPSGTYQRPSGGYNRPVGGFRGGLGRGGGGFRRRQAAVRGTGNGEQGTKVL